MANKILLVGLLVGLLSCSTKKSLVGTYVNVTEGVHSVISITDSLFTSKVWSDSESDTSCFAVSWQKRGRKLFLSSEDLILIESSKAVVESDGCPQSVKIVFGENEPKKMPIYVKLYGKRESKEYSFSLEEGQKEIVLFYDIKKLEKIYVSTLVIGEYIYPVRKHSSTCFVVDVRRILPVSRGLNEPMLPFLPPVWLIKGRDLYVIPENKKFKAVYRHSKLGQ